METVSSHQYLSPWSPASTPPQIPVEAYIGSFVTMISNTDLRYEGIICFLNIQDSTLGLQNGTDFDSKTYKKLLICSFLVVQAFLTTFLFVQ